MRKCHSKKDRQWQCIRSK